jgi:hypothetical protein
MAQEQQQSSIGIVVMISTDNSMLWQLFCDSAVAAVMAPAG